MNQEARKPELRLYGTVVAHTLNNIVALAKQVYDENREDYQSNINTDTYRNIDRIDTNISGIEDNIDSIENNIDDVKNNIDNIEANIDTIEDNIDSIETDISTVNTNIDTIEGRIDVAEGNISTINTNISNIESNIDDIESNIETLDHDTQELLLQEATARLEADEELQEAIDLLNANSSTQGSVQYWIKQAIDAVVADAPEAFDTLKEIADWIAQDQHGTAALINRVAANEEAIAAINTAIIQLETTLSQTDERLSDAISTANSEIDQLQTSLSEIDQRLTSAVQTANSEINQLQSDVTADVQDLQTFKTTVAQNEQTLTTEINNAKQSINSTQADLNQFKTDIRTEVESDISTAVSDSIAREQEIWTDVARVDGRVTTVSNKVTEVDNTVKGITDANGNIKYTEALQSVIDTGISNNTAFNNISSRWAVLDENQQVLEWMAAGFKSQASPSTSFASVYATGKQETSDAISALNTTIAGLGNTYVAKANLSTEVNTIVKEGLNVDSYSEVALQSDVNSAESRMSSKYDTLSGTVGTLSSNVASISTKANSNEAKISAITTTDGSGTLFLNESKVDSAMYNLLANTTSSAYSGVSGIADTKIAALDVTSKINGAVSSLREEVSTDYVAKADLSTEVESAIKTGLNIQSYSEIALDSDVSSAEARMASQYSTLDTNVRGISTTLAGVSTKADANEAKVNAITTTDSSSTTVLSQSALNSAMLLLLGQGGSQTKTTIQSLAYEEAGSYFATVDISTIVHNAVEDEISQAGVASKSYVDDKVSTAETTIYGYLKDGYGNIISSASIQNKANANEAKINAITTTDSSSTTVLSQSALNSAMILLLGGVGDNTKTRIESLAYDKAGDYFATIDIQTIAHNAVEDEIAQGGIASQSYVQGQVSSAETTIYSYLKDSNDNIISSASIQNTANANAAKLDALVTWSGNTPTGYKYTSGLVTETTYNTQYAGLVSSISTLDGAVVKKASVIASINNTTEESTVKINADKIKIGDISITGSQISDIGQVIANEVNVSYLNSMLRSELDVRNWKSIELAEASLSVVSSKGQGAFGATRYYTKILDGTVYGYKYTVSGSGTGTNKLDKWSLDRDGNLDLAGNIRFTDGTNLYDGSIFYSPDDGQHFNPGLNISSDTGVIISSDTGVIINGIPFERVMYVPEEYSAPTIVDGIIDLLERNSDETLKNKIADITLTAEQIADAPSIKFTWKDESKDQSIHVGTIAQYWQNILPEVVGKDRKDKLTLDYPTLATTSVINLAKEVVQLKARIAELESKLNS